MGKTVSGIEIYIDGQLIEDSQLALALSEALKIDFSDDLSYHTETHERFYGRE